MDRVLYRKRTTESLGKISEFYKSVGYSGRPSEGAVYFFAKSRGKIVGALRIVVEHRVQVLRGMYIAPELQKKGHGAQLLIEAQKYLIATNKRCYCLPYSHLISFYGNIGFELLMEDGMPRFLHQRKLRYERQGDSHVAMLWLPTIVSK